MTEKRPNHRPPKEKVIEAGAIEKQIYNIYEVAELLRVHHNTIRTMIKKGELPAVQIGRQWRIRSTDLEAYIDPNNAQPKNP